MNEGLSVWRRALAIVLFVTVMGGLWWLLSKAAYEWIPVSVIGYVFVAMMCLAAGYLLGQRSIRKQIEQRRD